MRVSGALDRVDSRQNDQHAKKGKIASTAATGKFGGGHWRGVLAEISDRKHLTLGNKPILATFSGLLSGPGFSRLAC